MIDKAEVLPFGTPQEYDPKGSPLIGAAGRLRADPLGFLSTLSRTGGDMVPFRLGPETVFLINHPDHIQRVFRENQKNIGKSHYYRRLRPLLGEGLFTLEGEEWRRQRQASQPAVSGPNLKGMVSRMADATLEMKQRLTDLAEEGRPVEMTATAAHITLDVALRCFFSHKLDNPTSHVVYDSLTTILRFLETRLWSALPMPMWAPTPTNRVFKRAKRSLDAVIMKLLEERLETAAPPDDLLDSLIESERQKGWSEKTMTSLRDQVVSILMASHETGANALVWSAVLLSRHPDVAERLAEEAGRVLGYGKAIDFETINALTYSRQVFQEVLRIYPPAWSFSRRVIASDAFGATDVPAGATLVVCPYVIHRLRGFWPNPEGFDPERFAGSAVSARHPYAFIPFAGGKHVCLGNRFAMLEGVLTLSLLAEGLEFHLMPGQQAVPRPATTLRPDGPVWFYLAQRDRLPAKQKLAS